jgi:acetoin utilization deacetylase AcuC-like enzyme
MRRLFYCDHHEIPLPPGHKFPIRKYRLIREMLAGDGQYALLPSEPAEPATIERVHDPEYVERFLAGELPTAAQRRIGFPWSEQLVKRTLGSVGGTLAATADALAKGYGGNLAGGTHHAFRGEGSGFCVFNDIAVAAVWARESRGIARAAVVDLDVHQGDGTALIFQDDEQVLTFSVHGRKNFPFRKQRSKIDVELEDGTGDDEYLNAVESVLPQVFAFEPQIVFYQSGVDALGSDLLGRLALTQEGMERRDQLVIGGCKEHGIPLVITLGGGYGNPIESTVLAHANTFRVAFEQFGTGQDDAQVSRQESASFLRKPAS